uniref:SKP1-like protein 12 n=1 Tax=Erigeron canadensis TaxID=72917 RepID=UPI001CB953A4|nr:SKP1-like protein 12 [Erigeron canadensis]
MSKSRSDAISRGFNGVSSAYRGPRPKLPVCCYDDDDECKIDQKPRYSKPRKIINCALYLVVKSVDGPNFRVDELSCGESIVLKETIEWRPRDTTYVEIYSHILEKVVYFLDNHVRLKNSDDHQKLKDFHSNFFKQNQTHFLALMEAAAVLQIHSLFDLTSEAVVDMIRGKTEEEILRIMNLDDHFTYQQMAEIEKEHGWWAF